MNEPESITEQIAPPAAEHPIWADSVFWSDVVTLLAMIGGVTISSTQASQIGIEIDHVAILLAGVWGIIANYRGNRPNTGIKRILPSK